MSSSKHILIVDDDREGRAALAAHLEQHGFRVTTASTGNAMHRALERSRIDLALLDLQVGEEDGLRLARSIRTSSDLPFIILARQHDEVDRIVGLEMGADDFLTKPVNPRELLARMRNILRRTGTAVSTAPATRTLNLFDNQITDDGLVHLKNLPLLDYLDLRRNKITDAGLVHLEGLHNLKHLDLRRTGVTTLGVAKLRKALPDAEIVH